MKFRYSGDWGLEFPYQGGKVKLHTNMGYNGDNASAISEALVSVKVVEQTFRWVKLAFIP